MQEFKIKNQQNKKYNGSQKSGQASSTWTWDHQKAFKK